MESVENVEMQILSNYSERNDKLGVDRCIRFGFGSVYFSLAFLLFLLFLFILYLFN